jgi:hypothetical protein
LKILKKFKKSQKNFNFFETFNTLNFNSESYTLENQIILKILLNKDYLFHLILENIASEKIFNFISNNLPHLEFLNISNSNLILNNSIFKGFLNFFNF